MYNQMIYEEIAKYQQVYRSIFESRNKVNACLVWISAPYMRCRVILSPTPTWRTLFVFGPIRFY